MSNYTQNVFFSPKDSLTTNDPNKKIKGSEMDAELAEISSAITTKEDSANKDQASGYAGLDSGGRIAASALPTVTVRTDTANTLTGLQRLEAASPTLTVKETDGAVDGKVWRNLFNAGVYSSQIGNDAENSFFTWLSATRTGAASATIGLFGNTTITGNATVTGTLDVTGVATLGASSTMGGQTILNATSALNATNLTTGTIPSARVAAAAVTQHQGSLAIAETQITDGSLLARLAANETVSGTWTFSTIAGAVTFSGNVTAGGTITKSGAGKYPYFGSATQSSGIITIGTAAVSGTPAAGDIYIQHAV